jgi:hypothetical protein
VNSAILRAKAVHGSRFKPVYVTKVDPQGSPDQAGSALHLPAAHSIQYIQEFAAFWERFVERGLILEENGMLLIGNGFPLGEAEMDRVRKFLQ